MTHPPKSTRQRPYHHGNLPRALLSCGLELLDEQGVAALTLRTVAHRVGVSHAAPYRHFANKAELLGGLAAASLQALAEQMQRACAGAEPAEMKHSADGAYLHYAQQHPARYRIIFEPPAPHPPSVALHRARAALLDALAASGPGALPVGSTRDGEPPLARWARLHGRASLALGGWLGATEGVAGATAAGRPAS